MKTRGKTSSTKAIGGTFGGTPTPTKPGVGAPKGNQNAAKSGHWARKVALAQVGFDGVDKRTAAGRELALRRQAIINDLGGEESLSQLQRDLIEKYLRLAVLIDSLDAWMFRQKSLINKRKRCVYPIVRERATLEDSAVRLATAIGLQRKPKPVPSLQDYIRDHDARKQQQGENGQ